MKVRQEWVDACDFHPLDEASVLKEVSTRVIKARGKAKPPVVLLDLDSTLYEVGHRTHQILKEWLESNESNAFPKAKSALLKVHDNYQHVGYSVKDTFQSLGLNLLDSEVGSAVRSLKEFWEYRFFTSDYLRYDRVYPGASEFANKLHELGAVIVYLTGRDEPSMGEGTKSNLLRDGFPWEIERTHLLLKKDRAYPDLQHKIDAEHAIRKHGSLVASFENEPLNLIALSELFPEAMHVFVDTVCSDRPALPRKGLYRICGFPTYFCTSS